MAEAPRTDESARRDRVTDAGIASSKRSATVQPALFIVCLAGTAVSAWVFKQYWVAALFLSYPVLLFLSGLRWNFRRRRND